MKEYHLEGKVFQQRDHYPMEISGKRLNMEDYNGNQDTFDKGRP